jgi:hypothetical protein
MLLMGEILGSLLVEKENGDVVVIKTRRFQIVSYDDSPRFTLPYRMLLSWTFLLFTSWVSTSSWLSTLPAPAIDFALLATAIFSSSVLTGPRKVTLPFSVTILTLCASIESERSLTTALRILSVSAKSPLALDCSPPVIASGARSLRLTAVLLNATGTESWAIVTVHRPNSAEDATSVKAILFNDDYLLLTNFTVRD